MIALRKPTPKTQLEPQIQIMIDSGAFSAWRLNKTVDLKKYCDFLLANQDWIHSYVNLDVIKPGNPETAAKEGFDNLLYMRSRGLNPIPVYHIAEDISWLYRMLDLGCNYIGLAATSLDARNATDDWYAMAWSRLVNNQGNPIVKVHAFGDTRLKLLTKYPWASADSSTWINGQKYGVMLLPNGKRVSYRQKLDSSASMQDIDLLSELDQEQFNRILKELNLDRNSLGERKSREGIVARPYICARFYVEIEKQIQPLLPIAFYPQTGLISSLLNNGSKEITLTNFDLFMAVGTNNSTLPILYYAGSKKHLVSYFYITDRIRNALRNYCKNPLNVVSNKPYNTYYDVLTRIVKR